MEPGQGGVTYTFKVEGADKIDEARKKIEALGASVTKVSTDQKGLTTVTGKTVGALNQQAAATDKVANATDRASEKQKNYFAHIARTTVQSALVNKAFLATTEALGAAIKQSDAIGAFPAAMAAMGVSGADASASMSKLREYVNEVAGDLGAATAAVTRFTQANGNVKASTAIYAGLNNALIAGTTPERATAIMEQVIQGYTRGKLEGEEFKNVLEGMGSAARIAAKDLGMANASQLQQAMTDGELSINQFMSAMAKAGNSAEIMDQVTAKMQGIEFASTAMSNAMTNGINEIIMAVGRQNIIAFLNFTTQVIKVLFTWVVNLINAFKWLFAIITGNKFVPITGEAAENLNSGAKSAGDMGNNLDKAGKSAKKLQNQLAAFDKMNVLQPPPEPKEDKDKGGAGAMDMDPTSAGILDDLFGKMGGSMKELSFWAKVVAGILTALAANALIRKLFGVDPLRGLINGLKESTKSSKDLESGMAGVDKKAKDTEKSTKGLPGIFGKIPKTPFTGILLGLGLLSLGVIALYNNNEDFKRGFDSSFGAVMQVVQDLVYWVGEKLTGAWNGLIDIVSKFVPPGMATFLQDLKLSEDGMEMLGVVAGTVAAGLVIAAGLASVAWGVKLVGSITGATQAMYNFSAGFKSPTAAASSFSGVMGTLGGVAATVLGALKTGIMAVGNALKVAFFGNPIGLIVLAVVALVAAFIWLWNNVEGFRNFWIGVWETIKSAAAAVANWFTGAWQAVSAAFTAVGQAIANVFQVIWQIISGIIILVIAIVAMALEGIYNLLIGVGKWVFDNVISPVIKFFQQLWDTVVSIAQSAWTRMMNVLRPIFSWINSNIIQPVASFFSRLWDGIVQNVSRAVEGVKRVWGTVTGWINGNIIQPISGFFGWLWSGISHGVNSVVDGIKGVFGTIGGAIKAPINWIIDGINSVIRSMNRVRVPSWVPGIGGSSPNFPTIPRLATGGIVDQATLAVVGEAGSEAVMPLENNTEWIDKLASRINTSTSPSVPTEGPIPVTNEKQNNGQSQVININVSGVFATSSQERRKVAEMIVKEIEQITRAKGMKGSF